MYYSTRRSRRGQNALGNNVKKKRNVKFGRTRVSHAEFDIRPSSPGAGVLGCETTFS